MTTTEETTTVVETHEVFLYEITVVSNAPIANLYFTTQALTAYEAIQNVVNDMHGKSNWKTWQYAKTLSFTVNQMEPRA